MSNRNLHLVAYYYRKPKDPKKTSVPGYFKDPNNLVMDETINITRGLKIKDRVDATVILDLTAQQVVKNGFNDSRDFPSLLAYYQENYPKYLNPLIAELYPEQLNDGIIHVPSQEEEGSGPERAAQAHALGPREGDESVAGSVQQAG